MLDVVKGILCEKNVLQGEQKKWRRLSSFGESITHLRGL